MNDWWGIFWLVVLLFANAFFVAAEFAVMSARRSQIEPKVLAGNKRAKTALLAMEHVSVMLAVCQLGITVCSLLILNVAEPAIHHLFAAPLEALHVPTAVADPVAFIVALLIVTFLHVTLGEMVPKNISVSIADKAVMALATPLVWIARFVKPIVFVLNWIANHAVRALGLEPKDEVTSTYTIDEVQSIVEESRREGLLEDDAGLLTSAFEFTERTVGDIAVPMGQVVTLDVDTTPDEFERAVGRTGFSRFVMTEPDGELAGYLHLKDVMTIPEERAEAPIPVIRLRSLANLDADVEVEDALATMQRTGSHVARVLDQAGATTGILFFEDVVEQLVGEIRDATQQTGERRYNMSVDDAESPSA
ncbi:hemolysin family protein [Galactobacter caseinivorans]|uniref:HlyC/CorC family transporter n=1 Tax=Galactobacter caseinivorans TaxID=2676123 RepID=A0A496PMP0_9MICC|nr:hemolysin family protein [Galactobacter caseinivorans]RKW71813.1 HlyC/CorC family transporter [Galactobacter caseinivorans]